MILLVTRYTMIWHELTFKNDESTTFERSLMSRNEQLLRAYRSAPSCHDLAGNLPKLGLYKLETRNINLDDLAEDASLPDT